MQRRQDYPPWWKERSAMTRLHAYYRNKSSPQKTYGKRLSQLFGLWMGGCLPDFWWHDSRKTMDRWKWNHVLALWPLWRTGSQRLNLLNALYYSGDVSIPVAFEVIRKPIQFSDVKTRKVKRASTVTKNELMRQMIVQCVQNQLLFATFWWIAGLPPKRTLNLFWRKTNTSLRL